MCSEMRETPYFQNHPPFRYDTVQQCTDTDTIQIFRERLRDQGPSMDRMRNSYCACLSQIRIVSHLLDVPRGTGLHDISMRIPENIKKQS